MSFPRSNPYIITYYDHHHTRACKRPQNISGRHSCRPLMSMQFAEALPMCTAMVVKHRNCSAKKVKHKPNTIHMTSKGIINSLMNCVSNYYSMTPSQRAYQSSSAFGLEALSCFSKGTLSLKLNHSRILLNAGASTSVRPRSTDTTSVCCSMHSRRSSSARKMFPAFSSSIAQDCTNRRSKSEN